MKKELERKKGEQLYIWHERLAEAYAGRELTSGVLYELFHNISVEGYIEGTRIAR